MAKPKKYSKQATKISEVGEPSINYGNDRNFNFFSSFEERHVADLMEMANLSALERLKQMRTLINKNWAMHGFDWNDLSKKHSIKIIHTKRDW